MKLKIFCLFEYWIPKTCKSSKVYQLANLQRTKKLRKKRLSFFHFVSFILMFARSKYLTFNSFKGDKLKKSNQHNTPMIQLFCASKLTLGNKALLFSLKTWQINWLFDSQSNISIFKRNRNQLICLIWVVCLCCTAFHIFLYWRFEFLFQSEEHTNKMTNFSCFSILCILMCLYIHIHT